MVGIKKNRVGLVYLFILALFFLLVVKGVFMVESEQRSVSYKVKKSPRFDILDRNGEILATNLTTYTLYVRPSELRDADKVFDNLKVFFPEDKQEKIYKKLHKKKFKGRYLLIRDLTEKEKYEISELGFIGLYFHEDHKRFYPYKNLFSHILGFVDRDEKGRSGFEKFSDKNGIVKGSEIRLSINLGVQDIMHKELSRAIEKFSARGGVGIVMDTNNFEIYSLVSLPDFNPYDPVRAINDKNFNNKATYDLHEMGSTFKVFTMALAIENGFVDLDEKFDVSEKLTIDEFSIEDFGKKKKGQLSAREIFIKSSNIGTAKIAQRFSEEQQKEFFRRLGLFKPLEIELIEKTYAKMPKRWGLTRKITSSYGHGIATTSMHVVQSVSGVVNGGYMKDATLLKGGNDDKKAEIVLSADASFEVRKLMAEVVTKGTGRWARSKIWNIGGKTGTAPKVGKRGYDEDKLLSSFVAAFPIENPQYVVYVFLDEPKGIAATGGYATGGVVAAPVVKNVIEQMGVILGVEVR